jgi:nanoRNase/pAp phosphatase (c-di-AMP/oligoRNAs hydrolase)
MKQIEQIKSLLEERRGGKHVVVLHKYPDPDAIASGFAHKLICSDYGIEVDLLYDGEISNQQNIALVKAMNIDLIKYTKELNLEQFSSAILVDNQGNTVGNILESLKHAKVEMLLVVDHHELQDGLEAVYCDIRKAGSTSTLYTQYLEAMDKLDPAQKSHILVATALMSGILTDTNGFIRADADDFHAAAYLSKFRDPEIINLMMNQVRTKHVMEIIGRALDNRIVVENYSIAGLGYLRAIDRDTIPEAADFLLTEENVHTALAYGIVREENDEEELVGSLRTDKFTLNPDDFIKNVIGVDENGHYFGGGKVSAGAFSIPIGFLKGDHDDHYDEMKWQVYDMKLKQRLLAVIGVNPVKKMIN